MKQKLTQILASSIMATAVSVGAQGTFVYDQQSADESNGGTSGVTIQAAEPVGQSFTPSLSLVGFIRLHLFDNTSGNGQGATVAVNLRSDSITGPILGSTEPVLMPDSFGHPTTTSGFVNFLFATPVVVQPGTVYYLQPVVQSGDNWSMLGDVFNYAGGTSFSLGNPSASVDNWFREGVIVPEPSSAAMLLLGIGGLICVKRFKQCSRQK